MKISFFGASILIKNHLLSIVAALFLTAAMVSIVVLFNYAQDSVSNRHSQFYFYLFLSLILIFFTNYVVIEFLFKYYGKKQIKITMKKNLFHNKWLTTIIAIPSLLLALFLAPKI